MEPVERKLLGVIEIVIVRLLGCIAPTQKDAQRWRSRNLLVGNEQGSATGLKLGGGPQRQNY